MNLEIDAILATVKNEPQLSYDEIKEIREHKLYKFYEFYLDISKNIANLKYALEELKDAKYVEYTDIVLGEFIYYIRDKYFYDVDLRFGGYVINKVNGKLVIKGGSGTFTLDAPIYFVRISEEDAAKMMLLDIIKNENLDEL
tara:strand:+ start:136 stop:561 length:426 start_codon:yes stop_codon:yes gene_type:complete